MKNATNSQPVQGKKKKIYIYNNKVNVAKC